MRGREEIDNSQNNDTRKKGLFESVIEGRPVIGSKAVASKIMIWNVTFLIPDSRTGFKGP